ncbi:hypothetical protein H8959_014178, partial [Pygathrix nigripes]
NEELENCILLSSYGSYLGILEKDMRAERKLGRRSLPGIWAFSECFLLIAVTSDRIPVLTALSCAPWERCEGKRVMILAISSLHTHCCGSCGVQIGSMNAAETGLCLPHFMSWPEVFRVLPVTAEMSENCFRKIRPPPGECASVSVAMACCELHLSRHLIAHKAMKRSFTPMSVATAAAKRILKMTLGSCPAE